MRLSARIALSSLLGVVAALGATVSASSALAASGVVGHVYVNDNTAAGNTVAGFDRHADGTLSPIPGSPFAIGGAGTGHGIGSQGALQLSGDGRYLLAADAGSNQISVLRIKPNGSLMVAEGSPVASGGNEPVSIAVHEDIVYVANAGDGGSNYTGFTLNRGGHLRPLADSTFSLPDGSSPGDVLFNGDGSRLVGLRVNTSLIDSFAVSGRGTLLAAPGSPYAAQGLGPFGSEFRPTNPTQLFVSNAHGGAGTAPSRPSRSKPTAPCHRSALLRSPIFRRLPAGSRSATTASTCSPSTPRVAASPDTRSRPTGRWHYSEARRSPPGSLRRPALAGRHDAVARRRRVNSVAAFAVDGGNLTELATSPTALPPARPRSESSSPSWNATRRHAAGPIRPGLR